jgi:uncharacterized OsmC-like protein
MLAQTKTAQPNVVNGINVDDLQALIEGVRQDAAKGKTHWRVTSAWQGQARSRTQVEGFEIGGKRVARRFSIDIDEPNELGGSNRFANPQEHLLAALNACMTVGYVAQCAVRGITLEKLEIETDGRSTSAAFSASIRPCRRATKSCGTSSASRAVAPGSSSSRSIRR